MFSAYNYKEFFFYFKGMHLGMGGNPYGPAGTGKTESVKALGGLLGRQTLVFNCDEVSLLINYYFRNSVGVNYELFFLF